jgi:hypothetical protein
MTYTCEYKSECSKYENEDIFCSVFYRLCPTYKMIKRIDEFQKENADKIFDKVVEFQSQRDKTNTADASCVGVTIRLDKTADTFLCSKYKNCSASNENCLEGNIDNCNYLEQMFIGSRV